MKYKARQFKTLNTIFRVAYVVAGVVLAIMLSRALTLLYRAMEQEGRF